MTRHLSGPLAPGVIDRGGEHDGEFRQENTVDGFLIVAVVVIVASLAVIGAVAGFALRSLGVL